MKTQNAIALVLIVIIIALAGVMLYFATIPTSYHVTTITTNVTERSVLTTSPTPYFPIGYYSEVINFSAINNGSNITVGGTTFRFSIPSNIETRTTTIGGVSTIITVTADYQCGISLGQRLFFFAQLSNDSEFRLDYCLLLNNAAQEMQRSNNFSMTWSLWQISLNTSPTVAIHMRGMGIDVVVVELWVSK